MCRDGYRFFLLPDTDAKPVLLIWYRCLNGAWTDTQKKKHNGDIKNLFGHIPCKSRYHGGTDKKRISDWRSWLVASASS